MATEKGRHSWRTRADHAYIGFQNTESISQGASSLPSYYLHRNGNFSQGIREVFALIVFDSEPQADDAR